MLILSWGILVIGLAVRPAGGPPTDVRADAGVTETGVAVRAPGQRAAVRQRIAIRLGDPSDSLYQLAMQALSGDHVVRAADLFRQIIRKYPGSRRAPDAHYWAAFAYNRAGGYNKSTAYFIIGLRILDEMRQRFPQRFARGDAPALEQRILGELAQRGDSNAVLTVRKRSQSIALAGGQPNGDCNPVAVADLNAVAQLDQQQTVSILQDVLDVRQPETVCFRRSAVFLLGQYSTEEVEAILRRTARNDPDSQVRVTATTYLSKFNTQRTVNTLAAILRFSDRDSTLASAAIFALLHSPHPHAVGILITYAGRDSLPNVNRRILTQQILQQQNRPWNDPILLRILYRRLDYQELDLRQKIINRVWNLVPFSDTVAGRWLLDIAGDSAEAPAIRVDAMVKGLQIIPLQHRITLYAPTLDRPLRERLLQAYTSRRADNADILRSELEEMARRDPNLNLRREAHTLLETIEAGKRKTLPARVQ